MLAPAEQVGLACGGRTGGIDVRAVAPPRQSCVFGGGLVGQAFLLGAVGGFWGARTVGAGIQPLGSRAVSPLTSSP